MTDQFGDTLVFAIVYMYFVAFAAGMGLLTAIGIGYKLYNRRKDNNNRKQGRKGVVKHV